MNYIKKGKYFPTVSSSQARQWRGFLAVVTMLSVVFAVSRFQLKSATAAVTSLKDTLSSADAGTVSNHLIQFVTEAAVTQGETIIVQLNATAGNWGMGSVAFGDIDLQEDTDGTPTNCSGTLTDETLGSAQGATTWGVAIDGSSTPRTITFTAPSNSATYIASGACVLIKVGTNAAGGTNQITNPSAGDNNKIAIAGNSGNSGSLAVGIHGNADVGVSATVDPFLTFNVSQNSITFGTFSSASSRYANTSSGSASDTVAHTIAVSTNATGGYLLTVQGATLTSGGNTITAITAAGGTAANGGSAEQFGIYATAAGGSGTVDGDYDDSSTPAFYYGGTASTADTLASASGTSATTTYSLHYLASVAATTEAGSYNTTLSYVATGTF